MMKRVFYLCIALLPLVISCKKGDKIEKPTAVDMGTGILWATTNLGASQEYNFGLTYAWASSQAGSYFTWKNCPYCSVKPDGTLDQITKYGVGQRLEDVDDAAMLRLKDGWRLPTAEEMGYLLGNDFDWELIREYKRPDGTVAKDEIFHDSVNGYRVTSKITGKSLFFPAAGIGTDNGGLSYPGQQGGYWTSDCSATDASKARGLKIYYGTISIGDMQIVNEGHSLEDFDRRSGLCIRPVKDLPAAE